MRRSFLIQVIIFCIAFVLSSCKEEQVTEDRVLAALDSLEYRLEWLDYRLAEERWKYLTNGTDDSLSYFEDLYNELIFTDPAFQILKRGRNLLTKDEDIRRGQILFSRLLIGRVESHPEILSLREPDRSGGPRVKTFDRELNYNFFLKAGERNHRRDRAGRETEALFFAEQNVFPQLTPQLVRLRNQQARREGYNSFFALAAAALNMNVSEYTTLLEQLDKASRPAYQTILEQLRSELGGSQPEVWDLGLLLVSETELELDRYLTADSQRIFVYRTFDSLGLSLGGMPLYWHDEYDITLKPGVQSIPVKPPYDVRICGMYAEGHRWSSRLMGQAGQAVHYLNIAQDRPLFVNNLHPVWREGISSLFASLCSDSLWLVQYAHVPPVTAGRFLTDERRAGIVQLRILLAHLKFEHEIYTNSDRDLDKLYWDILEEMLMIPRHDDLQYWRHISAFLYHPVELQAALYGDLIAAQTIAYLEEHYGGLAGQPESFSFLVQNYMRFGSRYPWWELVERGTGEPLNPKYLLELLGL